MQSELSKTGKYEANEIKPTDKNFYIK